MSIFSQFWSVQVEKPKDFGSLCHFFNLHVILGLSIVTAHWSVKKMPREIGKKERFWISTDGEKLGFLATIFTLESSQVKVLFKKMLRNSCYKRRVKIRNLLVLAGLKSFLIGKCIVFIELLQDWD